MSGVLFKTTVKAKLKLKYMAQTTCPFCEGEGCCNCDHEGLVPFGEGHIFKTLEQARAHDAGTSLFDLQIFQGERSLFNSKYLNPIP